MQLPQPNHLMPVCSYSEIPTDLTIFMLADVYVYVMLTDVWPQLFCLGKALISPAVTAEILA